MRTFVHLFNVMHIAHTTVRGMDTLRGENIYSEFLFSDLSNFFSRATFDHFDDAYTAIHGHCEPCVV